MTNYNFKTRTQPINRTHLGPLPSTKDTKQRLNEIKENNKNINTLKLTTKIQSGDEFFFSMNSCYKEDGKVIRRNAPDLKDASANLKLINYEINVTKKRIKETIVKPSGTHIRFDEEEKENEELKYEEKLSFYLKELESKREEIVKFLRGNKKR